MALPFPDTKIDALTTHFIKPRLVDQIFGFGTVAWKRLSSQAEPTDGTRAEYPVRIGEISGTARARSGSWTGTTTLTGTPASRVYVDKAYKDWPLLLHQDDLKENRGSVQIANYLTAQTDILAESAREDFESKMWTAQTGNEIYSLVDAIDGVGQTGSANTYMGISTDDLAEWEAFTMECAHTTGTDTGVSPSLENVQKMIHAMFDENGKKPDAGFCEGALWDHYASLIAANDYIAGVRAGYDVNWGTDTLHISQVPIYRDANIPGQTFASSTTRALSYGYNLYLVDWETIHFPVTPGQFLQLYGWMQPTTAPQRLNMLEFSGNIICDCRKRNGVIFNIDTAIAATSHALGDIYWNGAQVA